MSTGLDRYWLAVELETMYMIRWKANSVELRFTQKFDIEFLFLSYYLCINLEGEIEGERKRENVFCFNNLNTFSAYVSFLFYSGSRCMYKMHVTMVLI